MKSRHTQKALVRAVAGLLALLMLAAVFSALFLR